MMSIEFFFFCGASIMVHMLCNPWPRFYLHYFMHDYAVLLLLLLQTGGAKRFVGCFAGKLCCAAVVVSQK